MRQQGMRLNYLLSKIAEEASEVIQEALKTQQFGLDSTNPNNGKKNSVALAEEINDFIAVTEMLKNVLDENIMYSKERIECKKQKVDHYQQFV